MRGTPERRQAILEHLCLKRHDTRKNLIREFNVSKNTIDRDILFLSCSYPIYTTRGNGGGVHIADGYRLGMKYMTEKQTALLEKLLPGLSGEDFSVMQEIIIVFRKPVFI